MNDFGEIFERHFFSNHHIEAVLVESRFESIFKGCTCVAYSSFPALLIAAIDELLDSKAVVYAPKGLIYSENEISQINSFLELTNRRQVVAIERGEYAFILGQEKNEYSNTSFLADAMLVEGDCIRGIFLDLSRLHDLLGSLGVFITRDSKMAEKIRWARSSYGRKEPSQIRIAANGRVSEFQAYLVNIALDEARHGQ